MVGLNPIRRQLRGLFKPGPPLPGNGPPPAAGGTKTCSDDKVTAVPGDDPAALYPRRLDVR